MASPFCHLHLHTYYSLLDGANPIGKLAQRVKELGMTACAMTDHGNLFGALEFYQKMKDAGVKPIIGCEIYLMAQGDHHDKTREGGLNHLTLLCENQTGYANLCKMVSRAYLEGFYYKPRVDKQMLATYSDGIICLSGCLKGELPQLIVQDRPDDALAAARWYAEIFKDRYYIELMAHEIPDLQKAREGLVKIARTLNLPVVATNDCHYLVQEHAPAQEALMCIQTGKTLAEDKRMQMSVDTFYVRSPDEMVELFRDLPEAIASSAAIAERCNLKLEFGTYHFPKFAVPDGKDLNTVLCDLSREGLKERWPLIQIDHPQMTPELENHYHDRLEEELAMIQKMGFSGYFLIVADFIGYAKSKDIPVGPGRGSAAGSLVAYALKITDINPIPYNLLFERFLNPERISMPDMDIDFCMRRRDEVIAYVNEKYGNVGQIVTFGKMKAKAVIRDVGRVMGLPYGDVDRIAKMVPNTLNITLEEAFIAEPRLRDLAKKDPQVAKLMDIARAIEGFPRHASTHAAGVVISDQPLDNFVPLSRGQKGEVVTQFDMKGVEKVGLIKFDFLGLKTLTVIDDALNEIKRIHGEKPDLYKISPVDPVTYALLGSGNTDGIFQLESSGMTDLVVKLKPTCFEDIVALVALFRPGPLGSGMVDDFINRKHGRIAISYPLPQLEDILKDTYGVIVYQEQVMQIASRLANFSLGDADILRRAMGKKNPAEMAQQKLKFIDGCLENQIPLKKAEAIFDLMEKFAEYGFNKSHSAAYALVSYHTAYLKAHYPTEYMAALMTNDMQNTDKILQYMTNCREMEIQVLPPDVNESLAAFSVVGDRQIRFGLAAVKNVGEAAIEAVVESRKVDGGFVSLADFCERVDARRVNRRVVESLVKCGAFDRLTPERHQLWDIVDITIQRAASRQREKQMGQENMFDLMGASKPADTLDPRVPAWPEKERLAFEKESLGFYISGHPLHQYHDMLKTYGTHTSRSVQTLTAKTGVRVGGVVSTMREITTKKGDRMAFVTFEDLEGSVEAVVFSDVYMASLEKITSGQPLMVSATAEPGEESVKLLASEILYLDEVPAKLTKSVHIRLSTQATDSAQFAQMKTVMAQFQGTCPAYLHVMIPNQSETVMTLPKELNVAPSLELQIQLNSVFGADVTEFEAHVPVAISNEPRYPRRENG